MTHVMVDGSLDRRMGSDPAIAAALPSNAGEAAENEELAAAIEQLHAAQRRFRAETLEALLTQGGAALLWVGLLTALCSAVATGRALRPLRRITATAHRIASVGGRQGALRERIALTGPGDEIKRLADTFDAMLERLDHSFDAQRRFTANASHELRTPLALKRALVEVAVTRPDASVGTKQLGEALLAVNERHERLIEALLLLAEAENELTERSPVDLADTVAHALEQTVVNGFVFRRALKPALTRGDPILLERLAQNLVENAVHHNRPGGWISVTTATESGRVVLTVSNTGPAVSGPEAESLFQPFRRLRRDRSERADGSRGFGLGLSIVRAIAHAHGGEVRAVARERGGLVVTVTLPA
ncbi:HAMP domain-containing sensor histidine kinase [Streptomyces sp. NPDC046862]|uniref:sensor histidine kinase n=1 Tax=Streptomyces sp. NPDC046862 TaxID=3154603 RepID=UPI003455C4A8